MGSQKLTDAQEGQDQAGHSSPQLHKAHSSGSSPVGRAPLTPEQSWEHKQPFRGSPPLMEPPQPLQAKAARLGLNLQSRSAPLDGSQVPPAAGAVHSTTQGPSGG